MNIDPVDVNQASEEGRVDYIGKNAISPSTCYTFMYFLLSSEMHAIFCGQKSYY